MPDNSAAVLFPSGEEDSIALPYALQVLDRQEGLSSISGLLSTQVGWPDDLGRGREGFGVSAPGLFFEGIAYPLQSREIFNWMPALGSLELLNFPAQAWWGPESSSGAVQIREPRFYDQSSAQFTGWGGTGALGGLTGYYSDSALAIASNIRRSPWTDSSNGVQSVLGLEAKIQFLTDDVWDLSSGLLGFQNGDGEDWAAWVGDFQWSDQNFQTLRLRPFFETAKSQSDSAEEAGAHLDYDFNLAGLFDANMAFGLSRLMPDGGAPGALTSGFVQNSEWIDALGDFSVDLAFRLDFEGGEASRFSSLVGAQYTEGMATFVGDYAAGAGAASVTTGLSTEQAELGVELHLETQGEADLIYVHETNSSEVLNGGRALWTRDLSFLDGFLLQNGILTARFLGLRDLAGRTFLDGSLELKGRLIHRLQAQLAARLATGGILFGTAGLDCPLDPHCDVFVRGQNLANIPFSWPETDFEPGLNLQGGVHLSF